MNPMTLTHTFERFFESEKSSAIVLMTCTIVSISIANLSTGSAYSNFWQLNFGGLTLAHWVNDGLMAIFFLLVGLELERELYSGELSSPKKAVLPLFAALGGMLTPALLHFALNMHTSTRSGMGIPMATDIAFSLGVLSLLGCRVPASLKVFVVAFAVIDDLGAILFIALFYTPRVATAYLVAAAAVLLVLVLLNRIFRVMALLPYLIGGVLLWYFILMSGVHATVAGVALAFTIPYSSIDEDAKSPSHRLEKFLHQPVAFVVLPIFALANTAILVDTNWLRELASNNSVGIIAGLVVGKPLGVTLFCFLGIVSGLCHLPSDLEWRHIFGAGLLAGIGFTMSIFIANLAFPADVGLVVASKMAIFAASLVAGILGYLWLRCSVITKANEDTTAA
jgi:NhaA family Na+:H+ antiporter